MFVKSFVNIFVKIFFNIFLNIFQKVEISKQIRSMHRMLRGASRAQVLIAQILVNQILVDHLTSKLFLCHFFCNKNYSLSKNEFTVDCLPQKNFEYYGAKCLNIKKNANFKAPVPSQGGQLGYILLDSFTYKNL